MKEDAQTWFEYCMRIERIKDSVKRSKIALNDICYLMTYYFKITSKI